MAVAPSARAADVDACFEAVEASCLMRGLTVQRFGDALADGYLRIQFEGTSRRWDLEIQCESESLTSLPQVVLCSNDELRAHVGYAGAVCVSDGQGLSLDPDRRPEIVAFTALAAFDLLEKWGADAQANIAEFYNELEGYWAGLPSSSRARAAIAIDGNDRIVSFFLGTKGHVRWHFVEREAEAPREFDVKGLSAQRALYLSLDNPVPPPFHPARLDSTFIEAVRERLSPNQIELWTKLVRPSLSKNHPRRVALLVRIPRAAGGHSIIGVAFGTRDGQIDPRAEVTPLSVRRHSPTYMRERGGASLDFYGKHVVILGCGAVGSVVADALAAAGIGQLTLVDHDDYSEDNVFRHILDPLWIDAPKTYGLKYQLERHYPGVKVNSVQTYGQNWLKTARLDEIDAVVVAFGLPTLERSFNRALRNTTKQFPLLFTWLEPLDLGGHSVLVWSQGEGCLDCLYRDDEGAPALHGRMSFLEPNQAVSKNLTGCTSVFVPFGALQSRRTGLMAAEHVLHALRGRPGPSYHYWVGPGRVAAEQGLRMTHWWADANLSNAEDAARRIFGRPCKRCRGTA